MKRMDKKNAIQEEAAKTAQKDAELADEELPTDAADTSAAPADEVNPLQAELDAANAKADEYLTLAQRVQADFDNYRRRNESARADAYEEGARAFAATMLPVLDNLERASEAAKDSMDISLKDGVSLTLRQLTDAFAKRGITVLDPLGEKFDPNLANALMQGAPEDGEPGTVCQVFQKGYKMGDFVLRHAMVKVVPD